jgi:O-antigen/teichoic acid export membrane protein
MSKARTQTKNLLINWFAHVANLGVMLLLSPYVIEKLGKEEWGIWNLLVAVTGYMGILDVGIRAGTGRHIIFHTGRDEHEAVNETIRTSLGFFSVLVGGLVFVAAGLGAVFPELFNDVPASYRMTAVVLLPLLACNIWLTAFSVSCSSVLAARDRHDYAQLVNLFALGVRAGGTIFVLSRGYGLPGLVAVVLGVQAVSGIGNYLLARRVFSGLKIWPFMLQSKRLQPLLAFSIPAGIAAIAYKVIHQTDVIVVGASLKVALVSVFAIGAMLPEYVWGLVLQVCTTFFPPIQRAAATGDHRGMRGSYVRQGRMALMIGVPIYVGIILFGPLFLRLWMGGAGGLTDSDLWSAARVMQILCGARVIFLFGVGAAPLLTAVGHIRYNAVIGVIEAILNLGLSLVFVLVFKWGLIGVAAGTLVSMAAVRGVIHPWTACRRGGIGIKLFVRRVIIPGVLAGGVFGAWCWGVREYWRAQSWSEFISQTAVACLGYVLIGYYLLLFPIDRQRIRRTLLRLLGFRKQ